MLANRIDHLREILRSEKPQNNTALYRRLAAFDSIAVLSEMKTWKKRPWLLEHLASLTPGTHFIQTHPGIASAELRNLVRPDSPIRAWAEEYRASDLEVLTNPEVLGIVSEREIELISLADLYPPE